MTVDLLDLIEERKRFPLRMTSNDRSDEKYIRNKLEKADELLFFILPMPVITFGIKRSATFKKVFTDWNLRGIFDLSELWAPFTGVKFELLVFSKQKVESVMMGSYTGSGTYKSSVSSNVGSLDFQEIQPIYSDYISQIERALSSNKLPEKTDNNFFHVDQETIDPEHLTVSFYDPEFKKYEKIFEGEEILPISELAEIIVPRTGKQPNDVPLLRISDFNYPLKIKDLPLKNNVSTELLPGDVLIPSIVTSKKGYFIYDSLEEKVFASPHYFILRNLDKRITPEYLFYYFQSEVIRKYISRYAVGTAIQRFRTNDFKKFPVILPSKITLDRVSELFKAQHVAPKEDQLNKINTVLFSNKLPQERIQNEFLIGELGELKKWKLGILDKVIQADLKELNTCLKGGAYKSSLILSGSILEAVLIDWLSEIDKKDYLNNSKQIKLDEMIRRTAAAGAMTDIDVEIAHKIRKMRNLVHPKAFFRSDSEITEKTSTDTVNELRGLLKVRFGTK